MEVVRATVGGVLSVARRVVGGLVVGGLVVAFLSSGAVAPARADEPRIERSAEFAKRVKTAIEKGVEWLRREQSPDGGFHAESSTYEALESSARAYHALRVCNVDRGDAAAEKLYSYLRSFYAEEVAYNKALRSQLGTLEAGLLCLAVADHGEVVAAAGPSGEPSYVLDPKDRAWLQELAKFLAGAQRANGTWSQFVDLPDEPGEIDVTFTYFALLGLKAAARSGLKVPQTTWTKSFDYFRGQQDPKGEPLPAAPGAAKGAKPARARGWDLAVRRGSPDFDPTDWDTANALASMAMCRSEILAAQKSKPSTDAVVDAAFRDGLSYLGRDKFILESLETPGTDVSEAYFEDAYTIERAGDLLGIEKMGDLDWYGVGAQALCALQYPSGGWRITRRGDPGYADLARLHDVASTCYALLFLARGTPRVRWAVTPGSDDSDIDFGLAATLDAKGFEDFVSLVLTRWQRTTDAAVRARLFAKTTAVGPRIVPPLLARLSSGKPEVRDAAVALLKRATGTDHGYDAASADAARADAVGRWQAWWTANAATLHFDAAQDRLMP